MEWSGEIFIEEGEMTLTLTLSLGRERRETIPGNDGGVIPSKNMGSLHFAKGRDVRICKDCFVPPRRASQ